MPAANLIEEEFTELPVTIEHTKALAQLPAHYSGPFDRSLIAQAKAESLTLVTHDEHVSRYDVSILRA